jgi:hypothetical protein
MKTISILRHGMNYQELVEKNVHFIEFKISWEHIAFKINKFVRNKIKSSAIFQLN